jgi:hypothetical protein
MPTDDARYNVYQSVPSALGTPHKMRCFDSGKLAEQLPSTYRYEWPGSVGPCRASYVNDGDGKADGTKEIRCGDTMESSKKRSIGCAERDALARLATSGNNVKSKEHIG